MPALITGATGFLGKRLLAKFPGAHVLTRNPQAAEEKLGEHGVKAFAWNAMEGPPPRDAFEGVDTVIHLAGDPIDSERWSEDKKQRIYDSRVIGSRNLVSALHELSERPRTLVSASAVGIYGDQGERELDESCQPPPDQQEDFLVVVSRDWEAASDEALALGMRVVHARIGVVLGPESGMLTHVEPLFRWGLGSGIGSGQQWMPWIHAQDAVDLLAFLAERDDLTGAVNVVSPEPVTNQTFTRELAAALDKPLWLPNAPGFAVRLAMGEMAEAGLKSQRVIPKAALDAGFRFRFASIQAALADIYARSPA